MYPPVQENERPAPRLRSAQAPRPAKVVRENNKRAGAL
jgi:hypothetical protein